MEVESIIRQISADAESLLGLAELGKILKLNINKLGLSWAKLNCRIDNKANSAEAEAEALLGLAELGKI